MNIIDLVVVIFLGLGLIIGWYHGSVRAAANVGALLLAMVIGLSFHGVMARSVLAQQKIVPQLIYYSESDEFLKDVETVRIQVDTLTPELLDSLLEDVSLPYPVESRLRTNLESKAFAAEGLTMLGEYLSMTIAHMTVNIVCFIILFVLSLIVLFLVVRALDVTLIFPVLRYGDGLVGAASGLVASALLLFALEMLVPVGLSFVPFEELRTIVENAATSSLFYHSNFLLALMKGVIA